MLTWLAPNGGEKKDPLQCVESFALRWKTVMRKVEQVPKGDIEMPSEALQLRYFYHTFCKKHRRRYRASGRKWKDENFQSLVEYFAAQYNQDLDNGTLTKVAYHLESNHRKGKKARNIGMKDP